MAHPAVSSPHLLVGLETADDAGVFRLPDGRALVQTVDFFTPVVDEPYDWGRVAAANALSDVYAMGAQPLTALQLVGWPREELSFDLLAEVVRGGADVMALAGCTIVGGHSIDDREPTYGFAVTGLLEAEAVVTNAGAQVGDLLVLTKPLGTGVVSTAIKRGACPPEVRQTAVESMVTLNAAAAAAMRQVGVSAATDVTGFGLVGHLHELATASGVAAVLYPSAVPLLPGARELCGEGYLPGGSRRNLAAASEYLEVGDEDPLLVQLLCDAQTSGGLLIAVPPERVDGLLVALADAGAAGAVVGRAVKGPPGAVTLAAGSTGEPG